ncbi:MAG: hypothetical protein Q4E18_08330 [Clostridia bacterium]|nr:hypothetical protein [Clostridia bacterium]
MKRILALLLVLSLLCVPALGDETGGMLEKAEAFVAAGDLESAYICLDIAQQLSPDDPAVLRGLARLFAAGANYEAALEFIEEALALAPADGSLYLEKARLLYISDNLSEAEQVLRYAEICSAQPDEELLLEAALAYFRAGQYEKVIELCENQASDALRLQAARACDRAGQYERAVKIFETLPDAVWRNGCASAYAHALLRSGNLERAQALGLTSAQGKDEALATAIADGKSLRLVSAQDALIDSLSTFPVFSSNTFAEENREAAETEGFRFTPSGDGLRTRISDTLSALDSDSSARLLSVSPSGNAFLIDLGGIAAIVRNEEITVLTINRSRGAQNEYADLTYRRIENRSPFPSEPDSFCWSPDERYITMTFIQKTLINAQFMDLLLADTRTGDIFLAEATPKRLISLGALTATTACFDETGKYVYYLVYGSVAEGARCGLKRYCLETGEAELLRAVSGAFFYYPQLSVDGNGVVRAITDDNKQDRHLGVITFTNVDGRWKSEVRSFPNPLALQSPRRYYRSENSGYELFLSKGYVQSSELGAYDMNYLTFYNETLGTGSDANAIRLPVDGSGQAETMEISEYLSAVEQKTIEQPSIQQAALSPDGYSALILATYKNSTVCFVLDLDTLVCRRVEFPEDALPDPVSLNYSFTTLSWLEDGTILIPSGHTGKLFKLSIE